jgi:NADH:ubiquinone oxidoreductase subunit 6 (subunit J)
MIGKPTMRIDIWAALGLGILLPTLETIRRGVDHWAVNFTTMFEDYVAGIGLLVAAVGALRRARWAATWMVIIWSGVMFMMLISSVSQVERQVSGLDPEHRGGLVLAIKLALFAVSLVSLGQAVREFRRSPAGR